MYSPEGKFVFDSLASCFGTRTDISHENQFFD